MEKYPTIAEMAVAHPEAVAVFTRYNIDYCCGGHRTLEEACKRIGLDPDQVRVEILQVTAADPTLNIHPENWRSSFLIDFIVENHHTYIRKAVPELMALLEKVCERHGDENLELREVHTAFTQLAEELLSHLDKEEMALFPAIKKVESIDVGSNPLRKIVQAPINAMEDEHQAAGELMASIRALTNSYSPPDYACPTFQVTYKKLKEFELDLITHVHLENNILFKRFKFVGDGSGINS